VVQIGFVDGRFQAVTAQVFYGKYRQSGAGQRANVGFLLGYEAIERSEDMSVAERRTGLLQRCLGLSLPGLGHLPSRLCRLITSPDLVKFLRADGLLVV